MPRYFLTRENSLQDLTGRGRGPAQQSKFSLVNRRMTSFLKNWSMQNFLFFGNRGILILALVKDRNRVNSAGKGLASKEIVASIAATGFGLTALCIGHKRGYVPLSERRRARLDYPGDFLPLCPKDADPSRDSSITGPISTLAKEYGMPKCLR